MPSPAASESSTRRSEAESSLRDNARAATSETRRSLPASSNDPAACVTTLWMSWTGSRRKSSASLSSLYSVPERVTRSTARHRVETSAVPPAATIATAAVRTASATCAVRSTAVLRSCLLLLCCTRLPLPREPIVTSWSGGCRSTMGHSALSGRNSAGGPPLGTPEPAFTPQLRPMPLRGRDAQASNRRYQKLSGRT
jgi:hypothetical protein